MKGNCEKASKQLLAPNQLLCKDKFPSNTLCVIKQDNEWKNTVHLNLQKKRKKNVVFFLSPKVQRLLA